MDRIHYRSELLEPGNVLVDLFSWDRQVDLIDQGARAVAVNRRRG